MSPAEVEADYQRAGFGGSLPWGNRPVLVVIDMARAYFDPRADLYLGSRNCLDSAARVLAAARSAGLPVVHTRVLYAPDGLDGGLFFKKIRGLEAFVGDTELGRPVPEVAPLPGELTITKQYASAFFGTILSSHLASLGADSTIIVGVTTSGCVRATAVDALQHGYIPVVVEEAVGDRHQGPHEANLFDLRAKYAEVRPEQDVIARLRAAQTP